MRRNVTQLAVDSLSWPQDTHHDGPSIALAIEKSFLRQMDVTFRPRQISIAGCWMARAKENARAQGSRFLNRTFMASNRADANSPD